MHLVNPDNSLVLSLLQTHQISVLQYFLNVYNTHHNIHKSKLTMHPFTYLLVEETINKNQTALLSEFTKYTKHLKKIFKFKIRPKLPLL